MRTLVTYVVTSMVIDDFCKAAPWRRHFANRATIQSGSEDHIVIDRTRFGEQKRFNLAASRNFAIKMAICGGYDWLVLLDADSVWVGMESPPSSGFSACAIHSTKDGDVPGRLNLDNATWGLSAWFILGRAVFANPKVQFCEDYVGYGYEDFDFNEVVTRRLGIHQTPTDAKAIHVWHPRRDSGMNPDNAALFEKRKKMISTNFSALSYTQSSNLGDAIQTIALARLLPSPLNFVDRLNAASDPDRNLVVNGWLGSNHVPAQPADARFVGVHLAQPHNVAWVRRSPVTVGARDPYTASLLAKENIPNEMIGCATLTFPAFHGPRSGVVAVDCQTPPPADALCLTHAIHADMSWPEQWFRAITYLDIYRRASIVYTSRLHVALPCLAFGTPVFFHHENHTDNRFSILDHIGFVSKQPTTLDVSEIAALFRAFLAYTLNIKITDHEPCLKSASECS